MKTVKYYLRVSIAAFVAAIACPSCNDTWDDHYDVNGEFANGKTGASLWENLQTDSELAPFNRVLEACGYAEILNSPQMYTVWAPVITDAEADKWIETYNKDKAAGRTGEQNAAIKEFVMNHISLSNYQLNNQSSGKIKMRSGKYMTVSPSSINDNVSISDVRMPSRNGMIYKIEKEVPYFRNVWEAIQADTLDADGPYALDSVANFLLQYEEEFLDLNASVPGDIDSDGNQHYVDSVVYRRNTFFGDYSPINGYYRRAYIDSEDSVYYFLAPTNKVWKEKVEDYKKYFICAHDAVAPLRLTAYRDSLKNLYARTALIESCFFNVRRQKDPTMKDSITSTIWDGAYMTDYDGAYSFIKPFEDGGILNGLSPEECSNGLLYKTDDWRILPEKTFIRTIKVEAENTQYHQDFDEKKYVRTRESQNNDEYKVSGGSYIVVSDINPGLNYTPSITFNIPNTLSNCPYDIKIVFATRKAETEEATDILDREVSVGLNYYRNESNAWLTKPDNFGNKKFIVDGTKMDTICVTEGRAAFIPRVCNFAFETEQRVRLTVSAKISKNNKKYSPNLAIDCIIFEPRLTTEGKEGE